MKKSKQEIKNRILSFTKKREGDRSVSSTEVTKNLFTDIWKNHVDEVRTMAGELQSEKLFSLKQAAKKSLPKKAGKSIQLTLIHSDK